MPSGGEGNEHLTPGGASGTGAGIPEGQTTNRCPAQLRNSTYGVVKPSRVGGRPTAPVEERFIDEKIEGVLLGLDATHAGTS